MVWTFLCSKIPLLPLPMDTRKQPIRVRVKSYFFHKLLFGDMKLSDLECRNRKLSAHDCTDHIKRLFLPITTTKHETAMLLDPGLNRGYMGTV